MTMPNELRMKYILDANINTPLLAEDRRALWYLLDLLLEHEESVVECTTLAGEVDRADAASARIVMRSLRIQRRVRRIMQALDQPEYAYLSALGDADLYVEKYLVERERQIHEAVADLYVQKWAGEQAAAQAAS